MGEYKKYLHVERLDTEECEGLLDNEVVYVTAKVDGSNGCVFWDERTGAVAAGSRNLRLSDTEDNAYFHAWVNGASEEAGLLREYCKNNPRRIVYGEWMGRDKFVGAFKHYDKAALGKLIIFDVFDEDLGEYLGEKEWREDLAGYGLEPYFVKILAELSFPAVEDVLGLARSNDYLIEGKGMVGEGVVCKVPGWKNKFGRTAYGKVVLDEFKKQRKPSREVLVVETEIIRGYLTDAELEKSIAKVCAMAGAESFDAESRKMMGMLTSLCWRDLLEECPNWVKRMKNPVVDFGKLSGLCSERVKSYTEATSETAVWLRLHEQY